jgi:hypothetical protein
MASEDQIAGLIVYNIDYTMNLRRVNVVHLTMIAED